jgi:hypothetical protein
MLEIGEDRGALVVYTSDLLADQEIEIRPHHGVWAGTHTAIRVRHTGAKTLHAGVFGSLPAGSYDLRVRLSPHPGTAHGHGHGHGHHTHPAPFEGGPSTVMTVDVSPGGVTETSFDLSLPHP